MGLETYLELLAEDLGCCDHFVTLVADLHCIKCPKVETSALPATPATPEHQEKQTPKRKSNYIAPLL